MILTFYMLKRFEKYHNGLENRDILGASVHLPCLVVYLCDNRIEIDVHCHHFINKTRKYS